MAERLLGVHGLQCHTGGDGSFAYDLDVQRGIVSGRVALLLRSAEIKPLLSGLYLIDTYALASESEGVQKSQPPRRGLPRSGGDDYSTPRPLAEEWLSGTNSNFAEDFSTLSFCLLRPVVSSSKDCRWSSSSSTDQSSGWWQAKAQGSKVGAETRVRDGGLTKVGAGFGTCGGEITRVGPSRGQVTQPRG